MQIFSSNSPANDDTYDRLYHIEDDIVKDWLESLKQLSRETIESKDLSLQLISYLFFIEDGERKTYLGGSITRHGLIWIIHDKNQSNNTTEIRVTNNARLIITQGSEIYTLDFNSARFAKEGKHSQFEQLWNGGEWKLNLKSKQSNNLYQADIMNNIEMDIELTKKRKKSKVIFRGSEEEQIIDQESKYFCKLQFSKEIQGKIRFTSSSVGNGLNLIDRHSVPITDTDILYLDFKVKGNQIELDIPFFGLVDLNFSEYLHLDGAEFLESLFKPLGKPSQESRIFTKATQNEIVRILEH